MPRMIGGPDWEKAYKNSQEENVKLNEELRRMKAFHSFPEVDGKIVSFRLKDVSFFQRDFIRAPGGPTEVVSVVLDLPGEHKNVHLRTTYTAFFDLMNYDS